MTNRIAFFFLLMVFGFNKAQAQCNRTFAPIPLQPQSFGTANDDVNRQSYRNYFYYSLGQTKDATFGYLNTYSLRYWDNVNWTTKPTLKVNGYGNFCEWGSSMVFCSGLGYYANGIIAPKGKFLGPIVLKGSTWDTLPGTLIDSGTSVQYFATDHHLFKVENKSSESTKSTIFWYDNAKPGFIKLCETSQSIYSSPGFHTSKDRILITRIQELNGKKVNYLVWYDSNLVVHYLPGGFTVPLNPSVAIDHNSNRYYLFNQAEATTVYEIDTQLISTRATYTPSPISKSTLNSYYATAHAGILVWNVIDLNANERHLLVLCAGETQWSRIDLSQSRQVAPYFMNATVGTHHGIYALESTNGKVVALDKAFLVQGNVWGDLDSNCVQDSLDLKGSKKLVMVKAKDFGAIAHADSTGYYKLLVPKGNIQFYHSVFQFAPCFVRNMSISQDTVHDVPYNIESKTNLVVAYTGGFAKRWNSNLTASFDISNIGKYCDTSMYEIHFPAGVKPMVDSTANWDSVNHVLRGYMYDFNSLQTRLFYLNILADTAKYKPDSTIEMTFKIYAKCGESDSSNNEITFKWKFVYSYDPNQKQVDITTIKPYETKRLNYYIEFQNEGSDYAEDVILRDTLSQNLIPETFQIVGASFPYTVELKGRILFVKFKGIHLLPKKVDESKSIGFFKYSIQTQPNLMVGQHITNRASIYFDLNKPIMTNTVVTSVEWPTSLASIRSNNNLSVYPNPAANAITLDLDFQLPQGFSIPANLYDNIGNKLLTWEINTTEPLSFDISMLPTGTYYLNVENIDGGSIFREILVIAR